MSAELLSKDQIVSLYLLPQKWIDSVKWRTQKNFPAPSKVSKGFLYDHQAVEIFLKDLWHSDCIRRDQVCALTDLERMFFLQSGKYDRKRLIRAAECGAMLGDANAFMPFHVFNLCGSALKGHYGNWYADKNEALKFFDEVLDSTHAVGLIELAHLFEIKCSRFRSVYEYDLKKECRYFKLGKRRLIYFNVGDVKRFFKVRNIKTENI